MSRLRQNRGMTLFELIISMGILLLVGIAATSTFTAAVMFQTEVRPRMEEAERTRVVEDKIRQYLVGAYLGLASTQQTGTGTTNTASTAATFFIAQATGEGNWSSGMGDLSDSLVFTAIGVGHSSSYDAADDEFENLNERYGPQGGVVEVAMEVTPVGDAGDLTGPFLRTQRPADGDPTQGGWEQLLDSDLVGINFEFWDGTTWVQEWDSSQMQPPRLPAAVKVYYELTEETGVVRSFVVRLPHSDVTPANPAATTGGAQ